MADTTAPAGPIPDPALLLPEARALASAADAFRVLVDVYVDTAGTAMARGHEKLLAAIRRETFDKATGEGRR